MLWILTLEIIFVIKFQQIPGKIIAFFLLICFILGCESNSERKENKRVIITNAYQASIFGTGPPRPVQDTLSYSFTSNNKNYRYKLYNNTDTLYILNVAKKFKIATYNSIASPLKSFYSYKVADKIYNIYVYEFVWAADGGVTLSFSPEFGVLNTKHCCTALGQYEYPDEEYFIRAKALALNAILDYKLWQEKDTLK
jgi:hypothetical protein